MRKAVLGPRHRDWAAETAEGWIAVDPGGRASRSWATSRTCGRSFPPPTEKWRNPDRRGPAWSRDAAMTALTAAVLEADSRPDPEAAPIARLCRAARRLRGR